MIEVMVDLMTELNITFERHRCESITTTAKYYTEMENNGDTPNREINSNSIMFHFNPSVDGI